MKQKTHSGAKDRCRKITKKSKIMINKSCKRHLLSSKSTRQKRSSRLGMIVTGGMRKVLRKLLKVGSSKNMSAIVNKVNLEKKDSFQ